MSNAKYIKNYKLKILVLLSIIFISLFHVTQTSIAENEKVFRKNVVFYPQHQDDELLWAGPAILRAIEDRGRDNVYIVLVSNGAGIKLHKNDEFNKLSKKEKTEARLKEFYGALHDLGVKEENVHLLNINDHYDHKDFSTMEEAVLHFEEELNEVTHVGHTPVYDWHPQHRKNGETLQKLYESDLIKSVLYFTRIENQDQIKNDKITIHLSSDEDFDKIDNAADQYKILDVVNERYCVGYTSDHKSFNRLLEEPISVLHTPEL